MKTLIILYSFGVIVSFTCGVALYWYTADEGTHSYDYKIAKALMKYALVFPYGCIKVLELLEQEQHDNDV